MDDLKISGNASVDNPRDYLFKPQNLTLARSKITLFSNDGSNN